MTHLAAPQTYGTHVHPSGGTGAHLHAQNPHLTTVDHMPPDMNVAVTPSLGSNEEQPRRYVHQSPQPLNPRGGHNTDQFREQLLQVLRGMPVL